MHISHRPSHSQPTSPLGWKPIYLRYIYDYANVFAYLCMWRSDQGQFEITVVTGLRKIFTVATGFGKIFTVGPDCSYMGCLNTEKKHDYNLKYVLFP